MKNYIEQGAVLTTTAAAAVTSGDPVIVGDMTGVAANDAAIGETLVLNLHGVYRLAKVAGAIAQGAKVYLTSGGNITTTASGNTLVGRAFKAAANDDETVDVKLTVNN